jgi:hypothetical protein
MILSGTGGLGGRVLENHSVRRDVMVGRLKREKLDGGIER